MGPVNAAPSDREVEWQLDALDLRSVERWFAVRFGADGSESPAVPAALPWPAGLTAAPRPGRRLTDTYYDTEQWRIARAGFVLRTRRRAGQLEATMKDLAPATEGLRDRLEVTEPVQGTGVDALDPQGPVGRRVRALAGRHPLLPVLDVRTQRRLFSLVVHDQPVGEVALDDTTIVVPGDPHRLRLKRVELEVQAGWVGALQPFVEQLRRDCGLQPATLSKFEAGLLAAGVALPGRAIVALPPPGPEATFGELGYAVLRRDTGAMLDNEPGTRLGEDPEALHQMRVATRRLRAALALFGPALPVRAARLEDEVRWLAAVLGAVRDVDVQLDDLDQWVEDLPGDQGHALDRLRDLLVAQREESRAHLLEALDSRRYDRLVTGLRSVVDHGAGRRVPEAAVPAVVVLPALIERRHRAAVRAAKRAQASGELTDFHRLRIRGKRLRYAIEFTASVYGGSARRFGKRLAGLQDQLGRIQDAQVAYERLRTIVGREDGAELSASTVFAMGMVAQRCREVAAERLAAVSRPTDLLRGDEWRRLARSMDEAKASAPAQLARVAAPAPARRGGATGRRAGSGPSAGPTPPAAGPVEATAGAPPTVGEADGTHPDGGARPGGGRATDTVAATASNQSRNGAGPAPGDASEPHQP